MRQAFGVLMCALVVASLAISTMAQTPAFTTIARGDASEQQTARQVTVRTPAEWKALWKDHAPSAVMPAVDFNKNMIVGIFLGTKPSAGHEVEIVGVGTQDQDLVVEYVQTQPGRGTLAAQILTEPYHLVSVPTFGGTVRFVQVPATAR